MKTFTEIMKSLKISCNFDFRKQKSKLAIKASIPILLFILLLTSFYSQAQRFWLTTYAFPYGEKTGITLTENNCLFVGLTNGVIRSCDDGNHFDRVLESSATFSVFSTKVGKVLVGGVGKIFITDISGQIWDSITINSTYPVIQFAENSKGDLFALASGYDYVQDNYAGDGVFISEDNGISWTQRSSGLGTYKSCEKIAIDRNDRIYVASADKFNSGNGGLFISDNNGMLWKHIDVTIDGKNAINDHLKVGNTFGLSVSPHDSVNFSFSGITANAAVDINISKSIKDIEKSNFWETYLVSNSILWWNDDPLFDIYYAKNGDWYSSYHGTLNSGATYYSKNNGESWTKVDYGLGLNIFGYRDAQFFAENKEGKIFMVQFLDERVYWTDASILTSAEPTRELPNKLKLYPNPVMRGGNISIQGFYSEGDYKIHIYDGIGRKVVSAIGTENLQHLKAPLNPGFYYLEIEGSRSRESMRFVVR